MGSERGYVVVDDSGNVTANRQVDPVADIPLSGGGGSLPAWWTVDSTPGTESVTLAGHLAVNNPNDTEAADFSAQDIVGIGDLSAATLTTDWLGTEFSGGRGKLSVFADDVGFFGATPAAQPTGVAVDAAGIHAALVTLGLITA